VVTSEWLLSLPNLNFNCPVIKWLDNTRLVHASPPTENKREWTIELLDVHTNESKVLGEGSYPSPSPDGRWIAFVRGEKEAKQLWIMDRNGMNPKQLSHVQGGLGEYIQFSFNFVWSPDSNQVALSHQPSFLFWKTNNPLKPPQSTISILDITTTHSQHIASFDATIRSLSWLPNGTELLLMKEQVAPLYDEDDDHVWIQALDTKDGHIRTLAKFEGLQHFLMPTASPDGQQIAVMYDADHLRWSFMSSLGLISNDSANKDTVPPIMRLTHDIKLYSPRWSPDSQRIYVRRDYGAYKQIYVIDTKTGSPTQITHAPLNIESYALSPDGLQLAWIGQDAQDTRIIRVASSDGHNVRDLDIIPGVPKDMALSEVREIDWQAPPDYPTRMRGLLYMPSNYQEGTQYPLIVDIHGGGEGATINLSGAILMSSPLEWHMWAAKGYAVFIPEFRSSASFGSLAITRDELQDHNIVNCDIRDIEAGIDALIDQGIVDPQRLVAIGHSAGGRRVNWLTATTHRFRAVISKEGWADEWISFLGDPPLKRIHWIFGGTPWEVPQNYLKNSALFHCSGATTPTLFFKGNPELGGVDSQNTVHMLYNGLKGQGVETEYIEYPDEGHVFEKT